MTEYFRITGLHNMNFDEGAAATPSRYRLIAGSPPTGLSTVLTRQEVIMNLERLPRDVRSHALARGMSIVTIPMNIQGSTDADMEDAEHDLNETLIEAALFIETEEVRGTQAVLRVKADNAVNNSYKTIYHGIVNEGPGRDTLGARIKEHLHGPLVLTLYCEPLWGPATRIMLGPNEIYCPSFEEDHDGNGRADDWGLVGTPTLTWESTIVLHGCYSQKVVTDNASQEGIASATATPAGAVTPVVAYAWIYRPAAEDDITVEVYDTVTGGGTVVASASLDAPPAGGWPTAIGKNGNTWHQVYVITSTAALQPHSLRVKRTLGDATQITTFYVDKCFWKWNATTIPDEWCDHWLIYNHYDAGSLDGTPHEGHINYFELDDLKGDIDARIWARIEFETKADENTVRHLIFGRRTKIPVACWRWWHEGEDAVIQTNWPDLVLARCSAEECVSDAANTTGSVQFNMNAAAGYDTLSQFGHYDVFAAVYTDDPVNTQYRLYYRAMQSPVSFNQWVKQSAASKWQLIRLGDLRLEPFLRAGILPESFHFTVEYEKDATDTVRLDFVWLIPKDEPESRIEWWTIMGATLAPGDSWAMTQDEDFDYVGVEDVPSGTTWISQPHLSGDYMRLRPRDENRLYFVCQSWDAPDDIYECHAIAGAPPSVEMIVNLGYLPQFISPME